MKKPVKKPFLSKIFEIIMLYFSKKGVDYLYKNYKKTSIKHINRILFCFALVAIGSFFYFQNDIRGLLHIILDRDVLLTDYIEVGGLGSAMINSLLVTSFALWTIYFCKVPINGFTYAGLFTMMGFAFFGKSAYNILPIYLGVYLYSRAANKPFKDFAVVAMFACGLAPFSTVAMHLGIIGVVGSAALAALLGFIVTPVANYTMKFHQGYLLYNFGFAGGILAILATSIFRSFEIPIDTVLIVNEQLEIHYFLAAFICCISIYLLVVGLMDLHFDLSGYSILLQTTGRAPSDYGVEFGEGLMFFNMGLVGFIQLIFAFALDVPLNGPTFGAILSGIGFAAFGKHPRNILPVMLGCTAMLFITQTDANAAIVLTILFATGLAPIAGKFGITIGLLAGMMHFSLTQSTAVWQGGTNLYNNGFAAGFTAGIVASIALTMREFIDNRKNIQDEPPRT